MGIKRYVASVLLILLLFMPSMALLCRAATVWSDNFDDGNLNGWTISGASYYSMKNSILAEGNFSAADKTLRATGVEKYMAYSFATHPTMTTTGTWSWDLYFNKEGNMNGIAALVDLIDKPVMELPFDWNGYGISITETGGVGFWQIIDGCHNELQPRGNFNPHPGTWTHIDVTHDSDGRWRLYANGTLANEIVDKKLLDFSYFGLWLCPGPAIDNVVISDTIYVPPGSLKLTVKDSGGNALTGATVSSSKQPSGQTALSGVTAADGTVTFTSVAIGDYTLQVSKSGYVSGSSQGSVASGAKIELSSTLQAQPSSGIPGFPIASVVIGVLLCTSWYWLYASRP
ncbi:MAG: carboxypeptidase regulatory-like domain-containing protein, partial [Candidatus Bathyarchaeota archaeon]|nr:carboxypeptidase regulatory-like domain-containing protein [Candidatus Bathyarchaeota archaeon]